MNDAGSMRPRGGRGKLRLGLAGGGTGGHVVPGLNLVEHLVATGRLEHILWLGSGRPAEVRALGGLAQAARDVPFRRVVLPLESQGGGAPGRLTTLRRLPRAVRLARAELRASGCDALVGLGGFASASAALAAKSLRLPLFLLEVNASAGLATRALAPLASRVFHATAASLPGGRAGARHRVVGPILAPAFEGPLPSAERVRELRAALGFDPARALLVVLGGSQGAGALNTFIAANIDPLVAGGLSVLHQVGPGRLGEAPAARPHYRAVEYVDGVMAALDAADLAIVRAGASSLAEVAARRTPAIAVPYRLAAGDHQRLNAEALGAGVLLVPERDLGPPLAEKIVRLAGPDGDAQRRGLRSALERLPAQRGAAAVADALEGCIRAAAALVVARPRLAAGDGGPR